MISSSDVDFCVKLAGCSLATTPGEDNWVDKAGGLPEYICEVAKDVRDKGHSTSQAIAIAVSRIKMWAATSKDPKVKAKAAKAIAQWEKMKAKSHSDNVKASSLDRLSVALSAPTFALNTKEDVQAALQYYATPANRANYSSSELDSIMSSIKTAGKPFGLGGCGCGC